MKKKFYSIILTITFLLTTITVSANTYNITAGGLEAAIPDEDRAALTQLTVTGTMDSRDFTFIRNSLPLVANIDLSGATCIPNVLPSDAFQNKISLTSIILPGTIAEIYASAFENCSNLSSVTLPNSVTYIGEFAFKNCINLTSITIPDAVFGMMNEAFAGSGLTSVHLPASLDLCESPFKGCANLSSFTAPPSLTHIPYSTFAECTGFTTLTIPATVTSIGNEAFRGCTNITSLTIPNSVTTISDLAFSGCTNITSLTIPNSVVTIGNGAFAGIDLTSLTIPNSVSEIGENAFGGCTGLKTLVIPASVSVLKTGCFGNCSKLTTITCNRTTPPTLVGGGDVFYNADLNNVTVYIPLGSKSAYMGAPSIIPPYEGQYINRWGLFNNFVEMTASGQALNFDGADDYIEIPHKDILNITGDITLEAWVNPKANVVNGTVINKSNSAGANGYSLVADNGVIRFNGVNPVSYVLPLNTWTHIAGVIKGGVAHIYVNGEEVETTGTLQAPTSNTDPVMIGRGGSTPGYFNGAIDEVRIWNRGLLQCEIKGFMNCERPANLYYKDITLVANYHFNEGYCGIYSAIFTTLDDDSRYNNPGTLHGFALDGASSNWVCSGAITPGTACDEKFYVRGLSNNIPENDSNIRESDDTDFGQITIDDNLTHSFTIVNNDDAALTISLPVIEGANADNFSIANAPSLSIAPSGSTTFSVKFIPKANGNENKVATIKIANNSCTHAGFTFSIGGYAIKKSQSITFNAVADKAYGDASFTLPQKASSGLNISYVSSDPSVATVSGNTVSVIGVGTTTFTASQAGDATFFPATDVAQTFTVVKADQSITFAPLANRIYGATFNLTATASSGLDVTFSSSNTAVATISGNTVTVVGVGTASIIASEAGNDIYNAAPDVSQPLITGKADQAITFNPLVNKVYNDEIFGLTATASSGLTVTYTTSNPAVADFIWEGALLIKGAGTTTIKASQPGNENYNSASDISQTFTVDKAPQTITFAAIADQKYKEVFNLNANASSGLEVTYSSSNPAVATVSGNTITFNALGTATITASQAGNINFLAAQDVSQPLTVGKENQTVAFGPLANKIFGDPDFDLTASASSGLGVGFTSSNTSVATISGNRVTIVGAGTTTITASQDGNANYNAADLQQTLIVNKADQTITFSGLANKTYGDPNFELTATASSGLEVSYTSSSPAVATVSGHTITIAGAGWTIIKASQSGNNNYNAAPDVSYGLSVIKAQQFIPLGPLEDKTYGDANFNLPATANSGLTIYYSSSNSNVASISGNMVTIKNTGTTTITAHQYGNTNYEIAGEVSQTLRVNKANQTIAFAPIPLMHTMGEYYFPLVTSSAGLPVTYSTSNSKIVYIWPATKANSSNAEGTAIITATQEGNENYNSVSATQPVTVEKLTQTVNLGFPQYFSISTSYSYLSKQCSSNSGASIELSSSNKDVADIYNSDAIYFLRVGTTTVTGNQAGNDYYKPASASKQIRVTDIVINNFDSLAIPVTGQWKIEVLGMDTVKYITGSNMPAGMSVVNNKLVATGLNAGNYTFILAAYDTSGIVCSTKSITLNVPNFEIIGTDKVYNRRQYNFTASNYGESEFWLLNGDQILNNGQFYTETTGNYSIKLAEKIYQYGYQMYSGYVKYYIWFYKTKAFTVKTVKPVFSIPDEPLIANTDYKCSANGQCPEANFSPSYYDWYANDKRVQQTWKPVINVSFPDTGTVAIKVVAATYTFDRTYTSDTVTRKIYPKPVLELADNYSKRAGDTIFIPVRSIKNLPYKANYQLYYLYNYDKALDFKVKTDSLVIIRCNNSGTFKMELRMLSPGGTIIASKSLNVKVTHWAKIFVADSADLITNKPYTIRGSSSLPIYKWYSTRTDWWDQDESNVQNPKRTFLYPGTYRIELDTYDKNTNADNQASAVQLVTVKQGLSFYLYPDYPLPDTAQLGYPVMMDMGMKGYWNNEARSFSLDPSASNGATIDATTGIIAWTPKTLGTYSFRVIGKTNSNNQQNDYTFSVEVNDKRVKTQYVVYAPDGKIITNAKLKLKEKYRYGVGSIINTAVTTFDLTTDENGKAYYLVNGQKNYILPLIKNLNYEYVLSYSNWPPMRGDISFSRDSVVSLKYDQKTLEIAGMTFIAPNLQYDANKQEYTLNSVTINDVVFIHGTTVIKDANGNLPSMGTSGRIDVAKADEIVGDSGTVKEYYLSNALLIPKNKDSWFTTGKMGVIGSKANLLSFSHDTVVFNCILDFPWILGKFLQSQGDSYVSNLKKLANNEIPGVPLADIVSGAFFYKNMYELNELYQNDATKAMPTGKFGKANRIRRGLSNTFAFPEMDVNRAFVGSNSYWDFSMTGLRIGSPSGFGLRDLDVIYKESEKYFACNAEISLFQDRLYATDTRGQESNQTTDTTLTSLDELSQLLKKDTTISNVPIEVTDANGTTIYSTTYDEFSDNSGNIVNDLRRRGLPLQGIRVEFAIRDGVIDKIIISVNTNIPMAAIGMTISNITGGVEDLSKKDAQGNVSYNDNYTIKANCTLTDLAQSGWVKVENLGLEIHAWNFFQGSGTIKILNVPVGYGRITYDDSKSLFSGYVESNFSGFLKGTVGVALGNNDVTGYGSYSVTTPDFPIIPSIFRNITLGSFEAGFNRDRVAARVRVGLGAILRNEPQRNLFDQIGNAFSSGASAFVSVCKEVGGKIVEISRDLYNFLYNGEFGIGWDFHNNTFLFGSDIDVPTVSRRASRGDTLIYSFEVKDDTRKMLVLMDNGGKSEVQYQIFGPDNKLVNDNIRMLFFSQSKTSVAEVSLPQTGTWTVKIDTVVYGKVNITTLLKNNPPSGNFVSPVVADTNKTQIAMKFNDTNDTLNVGVYIDTDKKGFQGKKISQFKVYDNASVKFNYEPTGLTPGNYYFYQTITDRSGIPVMNYATGSLVITGGDKIPVPNGLKYKTASDSIIVYWNKPGAELIISTKVKLTDQFDGKNTYANISGDTVVIFNQLKPGHRYVVEAYNEGDSDLYSHKIVLPEFTLLLSNGKNPPVVQNYKNKPYKFKEGKITSYSFKAVDPEGGPVSYSLVEHFPKLMVLNDDSLTWCPEIGDAGQYTFHLVVSDGANNDTVPLNFAVDEISHKSVEVTFPSANLFEADNMFVSVTDETSDLPEVPVTLKNWRTKDSILVNAVRTSEGRYVGNFQLSYLRRSVLPVSNGDTIIAFYKKDTVNYGTYAYFNETPQIKDHIPPSAITDLKVTELNSDTLLLIFTVPSDKMDNGIITSPWVYDIRYSYTNLNSEEVYLKSLGFEEYEVGRYGTRDTVVIPKKNLAGLDKHAGIWFNIKVGDTRFNYSDMSNTASLNHVVAPQNVNASLAAIDYVKVKWEGPEVIPDSTFFQGYTIYRACNGGGFKDIGHANTTIYNDSLIGVEDGSVQYAVEAEYINQVTDAAYSNHLILDRYTNVCVKLKANSIYRDSLKLIKVILAPILKSSATKETLADENGYVYLPKTLISSYTIEIVKNSKVLVSELQNISDKNNVFEYYLDSTEFINPDNSISYQIYPNPSTGNFIIKMGQNTKPVIEVVICGIDGKMLKPKSIDISNPEQVFIDMGTPPKGLYTITISFEDKVVSKKLLIE